MQNPRSCRRFMSLRPVQRISRAASAGSGICLLLSAASCTQPQYDGNVSPPPVDWSQIDNADFSQLSVRCFQADGSACDPAQLPELTLSARRVSQSDTVEKGSRTQTGKSSAPAVSEETDSCTVKPNSDVTVTCSQQVLPRLNSNDWFSFSMSASNLNPESCVLTSLGDLTLNQAVPAPWLQGLQDEGVVPRVIDSPLAVERCNPLAEGWNGTSQYSGTTCPWPMTDKAYDLESYQNQYNASSTDEAQNVDTLLSVCPVGLGNDDTSYKPNDPTCRTGWATGYYAAFQVNRSERLVLACQVGTATDSPYVVGIVTFPLAGEPTQTISESAEESVSAEKACNQWPAWATYTDADYDGAPNLQQPQTFATQNMLSPRAQELDTLGCYPVPPHLEVLGVAAGISPANPGKNSGVTPSVRECNDAVENDGARQSGYLIERCGDGLDNDCDGQSDESDCSQEPLHCEAQALDADEDGYAPPEALNDPNRPSFCEESVISSTVQSRLVYRFYTANAHPDCDDWNANFHPGRPDHCNGHDDDCDGDLDEDGDERGKLCDQIDNDEDGWTEAEGDCNDRDSSIHPDAAERCNGLDDNCNGDADEGVKVNYYVDGDRDTFGKAGSTPTAACSAPSGYVQNSSDCNDANPTIKPGASEVCNGVDDNCDGLVDENASPASYYPDADRDGYGDMYASATVTCLAPTGYVTDHTDCKDTQASVHPGAIEQCNGIDEDCDLKVDEGLGITWYRDADGDGYGTSTSTTIACSQPMGYVSSATDCDDSNAAIYPGAIEVCNGLDDNCNDQVDENGSFVSYYPDADRDSYGDIYAFSTVACVAPAGYVTDHTDCNDTQASIHPFATEQCNGIDEDCDLEVDEGLGITWYRDADGDGYGTSTSTTIACSQPKGYVSNATDCDDDTSAIHPGATEVCNGLDDNCSSGTDEGLKSLWYLDADLDGYGNPSSSTEACGQPSGYVPNGTDCNDDNASIHPEATELVGNEIDEDCNGGEVCYKNSDGDGFRADLTVTSSDLDCMDPGEAPTTYPSGDCTDTDATVYPGAAEVCDGKDNDCDGREVSCWDMAVWDTGLWE